LDLLPSTSPKPAASNSSWIVSALLKLRVLISSQIAPAKAKKTKRKRGNVVTKLKRIEERTRCEEEAIIVAEATDGRGR